MVVPSEIDRSRAKFRDNLLTLLTATKDCLQRHGLPGLILLYSTMDILAWLSRPPTSGYSDVTAAGVLAWLDRFYLPGSGLPCTSHDLYAARCSLLHSLTSRSRLHHKMRARIINYAHGEADPSKLEANWAKYVREAASALREVAGLVGSTSLSQIEALDAELAAILRRWIELVFGLPDVLDFAPLLLNYGEFAPLCIHVDRLYDALCGASLAMMDAMAADSAFADLVYSRANAFFSHSLPSELEGGSEEDNSASVPGLTD